MKESIYKFKIVSLAKKNGHGKLVFDESNNAVRREMRKTIKKRIQEMEEENNTSDGEEK